MKNYNFKDILTQIKSYPEIEVRQAIMQVLDKSKELLCNCEEIIEDMGLALERYRNRTKFTTIELNNIYQTLEMVRSNFLNQIIDGNIIESLLDMNTTISTGAFVGESQALIEDVLNNNADADTETLAKSISVSMGKALAFIETYNKSILNIVENIAKESSASVAGLDKEIEMSTLLTQELTEMLDSIVGVRDLLKLEFTSFFNIEVIANDDEDAENDERGEDLGIEGFDITDFDRE